MHIRKVILALVVGLLAAPRPPRPTSACIPTRSRPGPLRRSTCGCPESRRKARTSRRWTCYSRPASSGINYENVPGWSTQVIETKLATPITEDGETIDTEVSQIVWAWVGPLGKVDNGQFINFPLSLAIPDNAAGKPLEFRTVQTYSNGAVVHWIDPSLTAKHPFSQDQRHGQGRRRPRSGRRQGGPGSWRYGIEPGDAGHHLHAHQQWRLEGARGRGADRRNPRSRVRHPGAAGGEEVEGGGLAFRGDRYERDHRRATAGAAAAARRWGPSAGARRWGP